MKQVLKKHNKKILLLIVLFGTLIKLYLIKNQPLWLDEKFSLYFAQRYSLKELLILFQADSHPGLYYSILKIILNFSENLFVLRFFSSLIFQLIAVLLLINYFYKNKRNVLASYLIALTFSFHPLFVYQSWQLRMYSLLILIASYILIVFDQYLAKRDQKKFIILLLLMLLGIWTHYSLLILSFFLSFFIYLKNKGLKQLIFTIFYLAGLFFIFSDYRQTSQFYTIAWVKTINLSSLSEFFLELLGINFHQQEMLNIVFFLILSFCFIFQLFKKTNQKKNIEYVKLIVAPFVVTIAYSILVPILTKIPKIGHFFPNISLLLTRAHLPFIILAIFYLEKFINKKNFFIFLCFIPFWTYNNLQNLIEPIYIGRLDEIEVLKKEIEWQNNNFLVFPNIWLTETVFYNSSKPEIKLTEYDEIYDKSSLLKIAIDEKDEKNIERLIANQLVYLDIYQINKLKEKNLIKELFEENCQLEKSFSIFEKWNCNSNLIPQNQ